MTARVYLTEEIHPAGLDLLSSEGATILRGWEMDAAARAEALKTAEAILVRTAPLTADMIAAAPRLRVVSKHGVGCDNIDVAAARKAGAEIAVTADANAQAVAEHTMALLLAAAKRLPDADRAAREDWGWRGSVLSSDLAERRILIVGYGRIGRRVAPLCAAFGMEVLIWDAALQPAAEVDGFEQAASLDAGLDGAGALTLHVPLTEATRGLIGAAELARLAPGALFVNAARGGIADEAALVAAVREGRLAGLASDVFAEEPATAENPLLALPGAALSPHTAAMSEAGMRRMSIAAARNALDGAAGRLTAEVLFEG
ncbi:MAG: NAD(P)-dependent oxidoreductase [Pseudomonadota bacterium]